MGRWLHRIVVYVVAFAFHLSLFTLNAQTFTSINFPANLCAGADTTVSFGYNSAFNIVVDTGHATLGHSDRIFLPDGQPCGTLGCSYRSPVTFTDFAAGASITSVQDIKYIRLNMEHSYIGDIYINITCPNGQKADIMRFGGTNNSSCSIPTASKNWLSGSNMSSGAFFGEAYDYGASNKCDSTASLNQPGIGWNYCWSNNTTSGYSYAPGDAIVYRSANAISHNNRYHGYRTTVDSSNVAAHTNFYHPDQNFSNLIGCPLNGEWYIEVIDGFSQDNGYVFEWELALDPTLIPSPCSIDEKVIVSGYSNQIDDTTFSIHIPDDLAADTTVHFTLMIVNSCGDTVDTTVYVNLRTPVVGVDYDTACDSYTFGGTTYTASDTVHIQGLSQYGCDSLTILNFTVGYRHDTLYYDTVVENELPYVINGHPITPQVANTTIQIDTTTVAGCDSTITVLLTVGFNTFDTIIDTVCRHTLPYTFDSLSLNPTADDLVLTLIYRSWLGADSSVTLMLHVSPDDTVSLADSVVANQLPFTFGSEVFSSSVDTTIVYPNRFSCDSSVHFQLNVWPNVTDTVDSTVCRHQLPVVFNGLTLSPHGADTTVAVVLADRHGADSTVTFNLHVNPDYDLTVADTAVENQLPISLNGATFTAPADTLFNLISSHGCDSAVHYTLHVWYNAFDTIDTALCRHDLPLVFLRQTIAPQGDDTTVTVTIPTTQGADSLVTVNLHVNPSSHLDVTDTVVQNQLPVTFAGVAFNRSTDTTFHYSNQYGCDSTVRYRLHVWDNYEVTLDTSICANHFPVVWHGVEFTEADTTVLNLTSIHGADSTVTLRMHAYPVYDISIEAEICDNQWYTLGGQRINTAGHHSAMLRTVNGCDSLVNLDLTVWPTYSQTFIDTVCATSGIDFDGVHYMQSGIYTHTHPTIHGCDSLLILDLNLRGLNLKAKAQVVPLIPTPENLNIELRDVSRAAVDRLWIVGDITSKLAHLDYTYPEAEDSVEAMLIAYSFDECADTAVTVIRIDRSTLFAPNAFTPGRDDNNRWQLIGVQVPYLKVWIYNRQGNLVATYEGLDGSWDGTDINGRPCEQGAYVYKAEYRTLLHPDRNQSITGTILLIR